MRNVEHKKWTQEEDQILIKAYNEGHTSVYIAKMLNAAETSVRARIQRLQKQGILQPRIAVNRELRRVAYEQHCKNQKRRNNELPAGDELPMSDEEIRYRHKNAEDPTRHITILAELNGCTRSRIKAILADEDGAK